MDSKLDSETKRAIDASLVEQQAFEASLQLGQKRAESELDREFQMVELFTYYRRSYEDPFYASRVALEALYSIYASDLPGYYRAVEAFLACALEASQHPAYVRMVQNPKTRVVQVRELQNMLFPRGGVLSFFGYPSLDPNVGLNALLESKEKKRDRYASVAKEALDIPGDWYKDEGVTAFGVWYRQNPRPVPGYVRELDDDVRTRRLRVAFESERKQVIARFHGEAAFVELTEQCFKKFLSTLPPKIQDQLVEYMAERPILPAHSFWPFASKFELYRALNAYSRDPWSPPMPPPIEAAPAPPAYSQFGRPVVPLGFIEAKMPPRPKVAGKASTVRPSYRFIRPSGATYRFVRPQPVALGWRIAGKGYRPMYRSFRRTP